MIKKLTRWIPIFLSLSLLALGVSLRVNDPAIIQTLRLGVYDSFQRLKPREYQPAPVRIIDLDDDTLEKLGQWPWPRTLVADMVQRLTDLGAVLIFTTTVRGIGVPVLASAIRANSRAPRLHGY